MSEEMQRELKELERIYEKFKTSTDVNEQRLSAILVAVVASAKLGELDSLLTHVSSFTRDRLVHYAAMIQKSFREVSPPQ